jgi:hypothetical protein
LKQAKKTTIKKESSHHHHLHDFFVLGGPDDGHDLKNSFNQHRILTDFIKGI